MILSFNKENCEKRNFPDKIRKKIKRHTIRKDTHGRWKKGNSIQFYAKNPRNGGAKFADGICSAVHDIIIDINDTYPVRILWRNWQELGFFTPVFAIQSSYELNAFAEADGFDSWEDMKTFFPEQFRGVIIYWDIYDKDKAHI